jgi:hypothetical protein
MNKQMYGGRRAVGKTTKLVKESARTGQYIVCADAHRVHYLVYYADKLGLNIPYPITAMELPLKSGFIGDVLVDDVEDVLGNLIGKDISMMTTSYNLNSYRLGVDKVQSTHGRVVKKSYDCGGSYSEEFTVDSIIGQDLNPLLEGIHKDFPGRKVRVTVELLEEGER